MEYERLSDEDTVNVLYEFETDGEEDILTQVLKLSDENWIFPEQDVSLLLVVTEVVSMVSENVTEIEDEIETEVSESDGEVEETAGNVVSVVEVPEFSVDSSFSSLQEMMVRLKHEIRIMNKTFFIFSSIRKVKHYCLFHENTNITSIGLFYKKWGFYLEGIWLWRISGSI